MPITACGSRGKWRQGQKQRNYRYWSPKVPAQQLSVQPHSLGFCSAAQDRPEPRNNASSSRPQPPAWAAAGDTATGILQAFSAFDPLTLMSKASVHCDTMPKNTLQDTGCRNMPLPGHTGGEHCSQSWQISHTGHQILSPLLSTASPIFLAAWGTTFGLQMQTFLHQLQPANSK